MKKRFLSLMIALAMMVGVFTPLMTVADNANHPVTVPTGTLTADQLSETKLPTTKVNLYKLTTKEAYAKGAPWKHTGGKIDAKDYANLGTGVKALAGAQFTFYKINGKDDVESEKILELLKANSSKFETVDQMNTLMSKGATELSASAADTNLKAIEKNKLALATGTGLTDGHTADTSAEGLATVNLADGYYWVIESKIPAKITGQIAVPFGLTLPLMNIEDVTKADGKIAKAGTHYLKELFIYPKNLETDKVKIDKNHAKYDAENKKWVDETGKEVAEADLGADYKKYEAAKKTVSAELGKKVPYESMTEIPRNYKFEEFSWQDVMSEGLTYNKDLKVTIDYTKKDKEGVETPVKGEVFIDTTADPKVNANYVTREKDNGFDIEVKKDQVAETLVKYLKNGPVTFHFSYSATVNKDTVVDKPETNSITYTPGKPNGGGKVTPGTDKSINVNKTWGTEDGNPTVKEVTYYVEDKDGKGVASITLTDQNKKDEKLVAGPGIEFVVGDKWYSGKFTGLDDKMEYTVREAVVGYDPTYTTTDAAGVLNITNKSNPDTLKPTEPKVENHGRKFVKYDQLDGTKRLAGAEFVVKNNNDTYGFKGKYLVAKTSTQANAEKVNLETAKATLDGKIADYNKLSAEEQKAKKGEDAKKAIDDAQKAYNKAFKDAANAYTWGDKKDAVVFVSDSKGGFEVTGLYAGKYQLEEIKAPAGYALNDAATDFEVKHGTYKSSEGTTELDYTSSEETGDYGLKIANKKVTIPQTGGIGTIIFTAIGLAIMASAVIAIKKRQAAEAR